jgi:hypothetical protein
MIGSPNSRWSGFRLDRFSALVYLLHVMNAEGGPMKNAGLALKIAVIANAILLVVSFVGCPSQRETIIPHIAPPPPDFQRLLPPDGPAPSSSQDSKNDKP